MRDLHHSSTDYILGLDLGQLQDYTALCIAQRDFYKAPLKVTGGLRCPKCANVNVETTGTGPDDAEAKCRKCGWRGNRELAKPNAFVRHYGIRYLKRWPQMTSYTDIVDEVVQLVERPPMSYPILAVDYTGVGTAVVDMIRKARPRARVHPIMIVAGHRVKFDVNTRAHHVPKKELVSVMSVVLHTDRMKIAQISERETLFKEMSNFKVKQNLTTGNESFECLVGGTMIKTSRGDKPIERVERDDDVLTRFGYNRVLWSGETKRVRELWRVRFDSGEILEGTPDHLVLTSHGWVELGNLKCRDLCIRAPRASERAATRRPSCSMESLTGSHRAIRTFITLGQSTHCIALCGNSTKDQFRSATTFTTKIATRRTTTYRISNASQMASTLVSTLRSTLFWGRCAQVAGQVFCAAEVGRANSSIPASGTAQSSATWWIGQTGSSLASSAASCSRRRATVATGKSSSSAECSAAKPIGTSIDDSQKNRAKDAVNNSGRSIASPFFARVVASERVVVSEPVPVYDIVVEHNHEFFANGVLCHNSWRERDHDDEVLAVACALWLGERGSPFMPPSSQPNPPRPVTPEQRRKAFGSLANRRGMFGTSGW